MDELKSCPFCGGEASLDEVPCTPFDGGYDSVYCVGCKSCDIGWYKDIKEEAISAWNRREYSERHNPKALEEKENDK